MRENLDRAFEDTIGLEGKYSNDKDDRGGETKYGISKRWHPDEDIKNLTIERAKEIYLDEYWNPCKCDNLEFPMDCIVFDTAINMGVGTAKAMLKKCNDNPYTYLDLRKQRYDDIVVRNPTQKRFINGWYNRLAHLQDTYLA
jgi:lysozyme family protein